jgi:hypothetical protein
MRRVLVLLIVASLSACTARRDARIAELERQLAERDREIAELRARQKPEAPPAARAEGQLRQPEEHATTIEDQEVSRALEIALVRQGGSVLPPWVFQVEPELAYTYNDFHGIRRDTFTSSVSLRAGLPWDAQALVFVPYVFYVDQTDVGSTSNIGDVQLALTKRLVSETDYVPELLLTGRWKSDSGDSGGVLTTGTSGDAFQATVTAVKTQEPLVLFGSPSYTVSLPADDVLQGAGVKLGAILVATPDTSLQLDVDVNALFATRVRGFEVRDSDRVSGIVDLGVVTVVSKDMVLNVIAGIGFTSAAPDFRLGVSLPITRY